MDLNDINRGKVTYKDVREWIMAVVREDVTTDDADQIGPMAKVVGMNDHVAELEMRFRDADAADVTRERALAAMFHTPRGHDVFGALDADERIRWSGPWIRPMLRLAHEMEDEFPPRALLMLFVATPKSSRMLLANRLAAEVQALGLGADSIRGLLASDVPTPEERDVLVKGVCRG